MEDDLKILKVVYPKNHRSDHTQFLNLSQETKPKFTSVLDIDDLV